MSAEYAMVASLLSLYERNRVTKNGSSTLFLQQLQHGQQGQRDQKTLTIFLLQHQNMSGVKPDSAP